MALKSRFGGFAVKNADRIWVDLATTTLMAVVLLLGSCGCAPRDPRNVAAKGKKVSRNNAKASMSEIANDTSIVNKDNVSPAKLSQATIITNAPVAKDGHPVPKDERVAFLAQIERDMEDIPFEEWAISRHAIGIPIIIWNALMEAKLPIGVDDEDIITPLNKDSLEKFIARLNVFPELKESGVAYRVASDEECEQYAHIAKRTISGSEYHIARARTLSKTEVGALNAEAETLARRTKALIDSIAAEMVAIPGKRKFYMLKYDVTQTLWKAFMGNNPSYNKGAYYPVERVSWDDCMLFLKKLNMSEEINAKAENRKPRLYRLPSANEWIWAYRAGAEGDYSVDEVTWHPSVSTHAVERGEENAFGLYYMRGRFSNWISKPGRCLRCERDGVFSVYECSPHIVKGGDYGDNNFIGFRVVADSL